MKCTRPPFHSRPVTRKQTKTSDRKTTPKAAGTRKRAIRTIEDVKTIADLKRLQPALKLRQSTAPKPPCALKKITDYLKLEYPDHIIKNKDLKFFGFLEIKSNRIWTWKFKCDGSEHLATVQKNWDNQIVIGADVNRDGLKAWQFALATHLQLF